MRTGIATALLTGLSITAQAQILPEPKNILPAKHALSVEVGGVGQLYSVNYERRTRKPFLVRVGGTAWSFVPWFSTEREGVSAVIVGGSRLYDITELLHRVQYTRRRDIYLETSADVITGVHTIYDVSQHRQVSSGGFVTLVPSVAIRIHPWSSGFVFRGSVGRPISARSDFSYPRYRPPLVLGASLGHTFR
jgi:hypothetical protein